MFAQRTSQQVLRRLVAGNPSMASKMVMKNFGAPLAVAASNQMRPLTTEKLKPNDAYEILVAQRRLRPTSPHLSIYRPQITWYPSMLNRLTGVALSGGLYIFGIAYLVSPVFGWHLESASMAAAFGAWPLAAKLATKFAVALPFTFHSFNGLRHLGWDFGKGIKNATVIKTGWTAVGVSVVTALYLATMV